MSGWLDRERERHLQVRERLASVAVDVIMESLDKDKRIAELEASIAQWVRCCQDVPKMRAVVEAARRVNDIDRYTDQDRAFLKPTEDDLHLLSEALAALEAGHAAG